MKHKYALVYDNFIYVKAESLDKIDKYIQRLHKNGVIKDLEIYELKEVVKKDKYKNK